MIATHDATPPQSTPARFITITHGKDRLWVSACGNITERMHTEKLPIGDKPPQSRVLVWLTITLLTVAR